MEEFQKDWEERLFLMAICVGRGTFRFCVLRISHPFGLECRFERSYIFFFNLLFLLNPKRAEGLGVRD